VPVAKGETPEGWALTTLDKAGDWSTGGTPRRDNSAFFGGDIPWVKSGDLRDGTVTRTEETITREALRASAAKLLPAGTVSLALYGATIGRLGILGIPASTNQACANCVVSDEVVNRKFLFYFLLAQREALVGAGQGGAQPNLTNGIVRDWAFALAPRPEQTRIVAKIEELLKHLNTSREHLAKAPKILKVFRQSVLAAACSEGESVPIGQVILDIKYGTAQKCTPKQVGVPVLRIPNIGEGTIVPNDLKYAKLPSKELAALGLQPQDILMIRSNGSVSLVGKPAMISDKEAGFAYAGYLIRLRTDHSRMLPAYLTLALQTHDVREQIEIPARSTSGVHNINATEIKQLRVNVPTIEKQAATVEEVETFFKLADKIEKRVAAATKRADRLTQAILAKAFRGELVPTEAELARREGRDYEPASVLLERIKAQRGADTASKNGDTRRTQTPKRRDAGAARRAGRSRQN